MKIYNEKNIFETKSLKHYYMTTYNFYAYINRNEPSKLLKINYSIRMKFCEVS